MSCAQMPPQERKQSEWDTERKCDNPDNKIQFLAVANLQVNFITDDLYALCN